MATMTLTGLRKTDKTVSDSMFGANAVFEHTQDGTPSAAYVAAAETLGVTNIRFGGGQADLDPTKATSKGTLPVDGENAINIVTMPGGALRAELVNFLDWCRAETAAGMPVKATLVLPTKHLDAEAYKAFAAEIEVFAKTVMQGYGDVIAAFQIGNEYWEMGETAYGIKASLGAEALERGMSAAGYAPAFQPDILVQMGTAGNSGSEFPATPGVSDFAARNKAANLQIIEQLSEAAIDAIDGVTEHYYYNKSGYEFDALDDAVKNIDKDYAVWTEHLGRELDLHITEWNVKTKAEAQHGMVAGSSLVKQFENMIELGVDGAHVWALDYHSRTALTLDTDNGVRLDGQGRLTNSAQGAVFDLMSEALVGKELVSASFENGVPGISVSSYASTQEIVFYITSRNLEQTALTLDLSDKLPGGGPVSAVQISMDPASSNGLQWEKGVAASSVTIGGKPYFYNEHDVDVILTDMLFADTGKIDLVLNPFDVVELTVSLGKAQTVKPDPADPHYQLGGDGDDMIRLTDKVVYVDGGAGVDTVLADVLGSQASISFDGFGKPVLSAPGLAGNVALANVERLAFTDGTVSVSALAQAAALSQEDIAAITELYVAYFDRAPAAQGLLYWANRLETGMSLPEIAESFFVQPETQRTYASFLDGDGSLADAEGFVAAVFNNVLGRAPSSDYWVRQLETNPEITPGLFILAVLNGAKAVTGGAADAAFLEAKTDIGVYFAGVKGLAGHDKTVAVMEIFDGSSASLGAAVAEIDRLHAEALDQGESNFLMQLVGVLDDPFALA